MRTVSMEDMVAKLDFWRQMLRQNCLKYIDKKYWEIAEAFYHELVGVEEFAESIGLMDDNRAEREVYMDVVSKMSGVSVATLTDEAGMIRPVKIEQPKENDEEKIAKNLRASRFVLNRIVKGEKYVDLSKIQTEWLENDLHRQVFEWAKTMPEHTDMVKTMFSVFGYDNEEISNILNINMKFADNIREADYFNDCVLMLANEFVSKRLEQVKNGYNELSDPEAKRASIAEISRLQKILKSKDINDKL